MSPGGASAKKHVKKKRASRRKAKQDRPEFTATEQRAARAQRIHVERATPGGGWLARSESGEDTYYLYITPENRKLTCTCADFIFRGVELNRQCKHVVATLLYIAEEYLENI